MKALGEDRLPASCLRCSSAPWTDPQRRSWCLPDEISRPPSHGLSLEECWKLRTTPSPPPPRNFPSPEYLKVFSFHLELLWINCTDQVRYVLYLVKVERVVARNRAIQSRLISTLEYCRADKNLNKCINTVMMVKWWWSCLEERRPLGVKTAGSPNIWLANPSNLCIGMLMLILILMLLLMLILILMLLLMLVMMILMHQCCWWWRWFRCWWSRW